MSNRLSGGVSRLFLCCCVSSSRSSLHALLPALEILLRVCASWLISIIAIQPFWLLVEFGAAGPVTVRAVSVPAPFSGTYWFLVFSFSAIGGGLIAEPASFEFRAARLTVLPCGEAAVSVSVSFVVGIASIFAVFPSIKLSIAPRPALWVIRVKRATGTSGIPVLPIPTSAIQSTRPSIFSVQVSVLSLSLFEKSIAEVEAIIFLVCIASPQWPFREVK